MKKVSKKQNVIKLHNYKVTFIGPEAKITFMVYGKKSPEAVKRAVYKDEARRALLRRERIYADDLKSMKIEKVVNTKTQK